VFILAGPVYAQPPLLTAGSTVPLPGVEGRFDHFALDRAHHRLFVTALGNNTLEVIDIKNWTLLHSVKGFLEPQGVVYAPDLNRVFVTNGEGASLTVLDGKTLDKITTVHLEVDPDNLRYDPTTHHVYVGHGAGEKGAIGIIDAAKAALVQNIAFRGHPESFQLEAKGPHLFVNVPDTRRVMVLDRKKGTVVDAWPLDHARRNFPMALDEAHHRLFVGCREPAKLLVFDTHSGKIVSQLPCVRDADDIWYDAATKRIYVSGGGGAISVFSQQDDNTYKSLGDVPTANGARTSFFDAQHGRLYLAVPHRSHQAAAIRVYETQGNTH